MQDGTQIPKNIPDVSPGYKKIFKTDQRSGEIDGIQILGHSGLIFCYSDEEVSKVTNSGAFKLGRIWEYNEKAIEEEHKQAVLSEHQQELLASPFINALSTDELAATKDMTAEEILIIKQNIAEIMKNRVNPKPFIADTKTPETGPELTSETKKPNELPEIEDITKDKIMAIFDETGVDYDKRATKAVLYEQLKKIVTEQKQ